MQVSFLRPLVLGKGEVGRAFNNYDQAAEIIESIRSKANATAYYDHPIQSNRWVCQDHPELEMAVGQLLDSYDRDEYESMAKVVDAYNKAVKM